MTRASHIDTEQALQESEKKYRNLFHFSNDAIFIHDLEGNIIDANRKAAALFDFPQENLLARKIQDLHPPEALAEATHALERIVREGVINFQVNFRKSNGSIFAAEVSASLFRIGDTKVVQEIVRDVSQRIETESALQRRNEYLQALHQTSLRLVRRLDVETLLRDLVDRSGKLVGTSDGYILIFEPETGDLHARVCIGRYEKLLGYRLKPGEGLAGKVWESGKAMMVDHYSQWPGRLTDETFDSLKTDLGIPLSSGGRTIGVLGVSSFDKDTLFGKDEIEVLTRFADLAAIVLDNAQLHESLQRELIEKKETEKALTEAHETFLTVLDGIDATIYAADMNTYEILFMNKYMQDVFGGDLKGKICYKMFRGADAPCSHCTNQKLLDASGNPTGLDVWEGKNPISGRWYLNHDRAVKWTDGRYVRLQIATDITTMKELEEKRRQTERHQRQSQKMEAIGTLAGGIAHDFNNILSAIIGFSELSLLDVEAESTVHINLTEVLRAGSRARDLVRQILAFSRQTDQEYGPIQLGDAVLDALKLLRSTLPSSIDIRHEIETDTANVLADPTQIHQIVMNLCTNAAHAIQKDGGVIHIALDYVNTESRPIHAAPHLSPGLYARLKVADNGHGIPDEIIDSIFDPYFTTKQKGEGTGMGLAVVHGIVKGLGGGIAVQSAPEKETVFDVYLPTIQESILDPSPRSTSLPTGSEHILFVDDEPALVELGKKTLENLGYRVSTCHGSVDALALFRTKGEHIDLVVTDMTMPKMTGDKLAQKLMDIRPDIPIIICTGFSNRISDKRAAEMGIRAFLLKPVVMEKLARIVRSVLDASGNLPLAPPRSESGL